MQNKKRDLYLYHAYISIYVHPTKSDSLTTKHEFKSLTMVWWWRWMKVDEAARIRNINQTESTCSTIGLELWTQISNLRSNWFTLLLSFSISSLEIRLQICTYWRNIKRKRALINQWWKPGDNDKKLTLDDQLHNLWTRTKKYNHT